MSQDELVRASGVSKGQISKLERSAGPNSRELTRAWAEKFAAALRMPADRIMFWDKYGPPDEDDSDHLPSESVAEALTSSAAPRTVKLKGYVGASGEAVYYRLADEDLEEVEAPEGATDHTVAVEVRGKSLGPALESWLVYYDDVRSPITPDMLNQLCVVGLADDRLLVKRLERKDGQVVLVSNNGDPDITGAVIEWAAKVTAMKPR
ncbi:XRE family transcriptional regulator [Tardiphaga sp. 866_E4_N2_1]|uniref:XRE family transcriptional regulator n=1 Tax=unclassified Tardiphaga TaxID=2631404 RepID=UPI003F22F629